MITPSPQRATATAPPPASNSGPVYDESVAEKWFTVSSTTRMYVEVEPNKLSSDLKNLNIGFVRL